MSLKPSAARKAFASIRFSGGGLDPARFTQLLGVTPTTAYREGESIKIGRSDHRRIAETGLWLLNTDDRVTGSDIETHIRYADRLLAGTPYDRDFDAHLLKLTESSDARLDVTLFWHGYASASYPEVSRCFIDRVKHLGGQVEYDFDKDSEEAAGTTGFSVAV